MTDEKAVEELKDDCINCPVDGYRKGAECLDCYIGYAIKALEKQIPKKPIENIYYNYTCPSCPIVFTENDIGDRYCWNCGQAIDWSVDE